MMKDMMELYVTRRCVRRSMANHATVRVPVRMEVANVLILTRARRVMSRNRIAPTAARDMVLVPFLLENVYVTKRVMERNCMPVMTVLRCYVREGAEVTESVYKAFVSAIRVGQDLLVRHRCVNLTATIVDFVPTESVYVVSDIQEMHVRRSFRSHRAQPPVRYPVRRNVSPVSSLRSSVNTTSVIASALKNVHQVVVVMTIT